jgi:hypothetical protein
VAQKSLKQAPRRQIESIDRVGDWGDVTYRHNLSCGHAEIRKRKSTKTHIACMGCLKASDFQNTASPVVPRIEPVEPVLPEWTVIEETASGEAQIERLRAAIAAHNGIAVDAVDVVTSQQTAATEVAYVLAFIDTASALRILRKTHDT